MVDVRFFPGPNHPSDLIVFEVDSGVLAAGVPGLQFAGCNKPLVKGPSLTLLHRWLREFEPHLAIVNAVAYKEVVRGALYSQRMNAELFSALAVLGLILAGVGIFSVVSLSVTRRTREIGLRKAIGATGGEINRLVIRQALGPVVVGLAGGLVVSMGASRLVRSILFGVEPSDPLGLVGGSVVLLLTATLAAYLPARRAGRVDPVRALKVE
ncbi:MAG: hypothetical protein MUO50_15175 [Longimicrobiales bacterium]|nr:hypothetical protein [Longimicrobiales bacterium]